MIPQLDKLQGLIIIYGKSVKLEKKVETNCYVIYRQQQASRSPMLNYVDLKMYYIPIGNFMHLDENEKSKFLTISNDSLSLS